MVLCCAALNGDVLCCVVLGCPMPPCFITTAGQPYPPQGRKWGFSGARLEPEGPWKRTTCCHHRGPTPSPSREDAGFFGTRLEPDRPLTLSISCW